MRIASSISKFVLSVCEIKTHEIIPSSWNASVQGFEETETVWWSNKFKPGERRHYFWKPIKYEGYYRRGIQRQRPKRQWSTPCPSTNIIRHTGDSKLLGRMETSMLPRVLLDDDCRIPDHDMLLLIMMMMITWWLHNDVDDLMVRNDP